MRSTKCFAEHGHLSVCVKIDGQTVHEKSIEDPFVTTRSVVTLSIWEWLCLLVKRPRQIEFALNIRADGVAQKRWFAGQDACDRCATTIGYPHDGSNASDPGYHHGSERLCEACFYGVEAANVEPVGLSRP